MKVAHWLLVRDKSSCHRYCTPCCGLSALHKDAEPSCLEACCLVSTKFGDASSNSIHIEHTASTVIYRHSCEVSWFGPVASPDAHLYLPTSELNVLLVYADAVTALWVGSETAVVHRIAMFD
ncbi:hypothetical protein Anapl_05147 [Anas platyrhynchos]|uniref:Uncharacterized protein n=1 Tax=Anas platyrhynchos TaxID=8839 RepID=R0JP82_ANAPL|nr:hypothetical protein Anapl_05147 [Anas platyrhynchos]